MMTDAYLMSPVSQNKGFHAPGALLSGLELNSWTVVENSEMASPKCGLSDAS